MSITGPDPEELGESLELLRQKGYLWIKQAALLIGCHPHTLREKMRQGKVRWIWIGERRVISKDEIFRYKTHGNWPAGLTDEELKEAGPNPLWEREPPVGEGVEAHLLPYSCPKCGHILEQDV